MAKTKTRTRKADASGWVATGLDRTAGRMHEDREQIVKAAVVGSDIQPSNVMQGVDEAERRFHLAGAIEPPYNPTTLAAMIEHSNSLRQNVDAYATNIDGFGHKLDPVVDLKAKDADDKIAQAIALESSSNADPNEPVQMPSSQEVQAKKQQIESMMMAEKFRLENFFEFCAVDMSFTTLRRRTRQDLEVIGNAYWEVLRNGLGEIAEFAYVPSFTVRLLPLDKFYTDIEEKRKTSLFGYTTVRRKKQFRKFVQIFEAFAVYFKEFGDPRTFSRKTGQLIEDPPNHQWADGDGPATELVHFKIHSPRSAYGVPRWIGNLLSVLGSRQAEEVNFLYFDNKSIPPLAMLVSGGRMNADSIKRIEDHISANIKGKKNFHKMLIIEAEGTGGGTLTGGDGNRTKIEIKPLTDTQSKDALFQNYDERNMDKVGMAFRLPRLLRGDIRDFNRATADAALEFAEQQVFAPERQEFDFVLNRKVLPAMGIKFWKFASLTASVKDSETLAKIIVDATNAGILVPEESRELFHDVFNKELSIIDAAWTKQPIQLTIAGVDPNDPTSTPAAAGAGGEAPPPEEAEKASEGGPKIAVTRTALGNVITVNEVREAHGLTPLAGPEGAMSIAAYTEEQRRRRGETAPPEGEAEAQKDASGVDSAGSIASPMPTVADGSVMTIGDLRDRAGALTVAQARRLRRQPPKVPAEKIAANALLAIRDQLIEAETRKAGEEFMARKRMELAGQLTPEFIRSVIPAPDAE